MSVPEYLGAVAVPEEGWFIWVGPRKTDIIELAIRCGDAGCDDATVELLGRDFPDKWMHPVLNVKSHHRQFASEQPFKH